MAGKRKAKPKLSDEKQSKRFIETARKLQADESGTKFEHAFQKVVPRKKASDKGD